MCPTSLWGTMLSQRVGKYLSARYTGFGRLIVSVFFIFLCTPLSSVTSEDFLAYDRRRSLPDKLVGQLVPVCWLKRAPSDSPMYFCIAGVCFLMVYLERRFCGHVLPDKLVGHSRGGFKTPACLEPVSNLGLRRRWDGLPVYICLHHVFS